MTSPLNKSGIIVFSIIGVLTIIGAAWMAPSGESNDTWLYVLSIWMILFSAFQIRTSVNTPKISKLVFTILAGAFAIVLLAWWANGAEQAWIFLSSIVILLVSFFVLVPQKK